MKRRLFFPALLLVLLLSPFTAKADSESPIPAGDAIDYCLTQKIIRPETDGSLEIGMPLSKIQFIVMASRAYGLFDDGGEPLYLSQGGHFDAAARTALVDPARYPAEEWALPISRYEAAVICYQAMAMFGGYVYESDPSYLNAAADRDSIPPEYRHIVNALYSQGIMNGVDDQRTFCGWDMITAAQGAALIHRLLEEDVRVIFPLPPNFDQLLGSCTTHYGGGVSYGGYRDNRIANLLKASRALDGFVLEPGAVFSFNDILGNPGKAEGYLIAPIIDNAKSAMGYGGGVCQVSTMVYNAALGSNLSILERHSHSLRSAYIGPGLDSTIYFPTLNLRFCNDYAVPLKLVFVHDEKRENVTMSFYGSAALSPPQVSLVVTQSNGVYTLTRRADGVVNYTTSSKYKS